MANGYRNTYWGETVVERQRETPALKFENYAGRENDADFQLFSEQDRMMGENTTLYYLFYKNGLKYISYELIYTPEIEKRLISKFENRKIQTYKTNTINKKEIEEKNNIIFYSYFAGEDAWISELKQNQSVVEDIINSSNSNGTGTLYIINFNELTNVYIYSNVYSGSIYVVYTEAYQEKF